ncbi:CBS domain-containing protein [Amycolatopsis cynarae]|uniref:CBS domain-containing protein n=1 Tax=Amycolatopsis cynarae TaxID=2995223 RepID=A0ABY7ATI4_9PSEU|nr:CBS domain-containing protein [Amycolatopsis sp. HUAS 11-8]WAL63272.1 CBS domain-containing protein [Amycolatopsis sp. HUAS 11-8]
MRARDIMSHPVITAKPETPVKTAELLLSQHGYTALPVVDDDGALVGIVSEEDFVADRFPQEPRKPARTVGEVMTSPAAAVDVNAGARQLARMMVERHMRSVPVTDRGRLAGIVTRHDFLRVLARPDQVLARDVEQRLAVFGGPERWVVDVRDGEATIIDRYDSPKDREVAVILAEGVPGIVRARSYAGEIERQEEQA